MNRTQAYKADKCGDLYVDEDDDIWCVFGTESGFCYGTFYTREQAIEYMDAIKPTQSK